MQIGTQYLGLVEISRGLSLMIKYPLPRDHVHSEQLDPITIGH